MASSICGVFDAGPKVATILVARKREFLGIDMPVIVP
jgi:hypothetical protein